MVNYDEEILDSGTGEDGVARQKEENVHCGELKDDEGEE